MASRSQTQFAQPGDILLVIRKSLPFSSCAAQLSKIDNHPTRAYSRLLGGYFVVGWLRKLQLRTDDF
jgi:hypothetical protein